MNNIPSPFLIKIFYEREGKYVENPFPGHNDPGLTFEEWITRAYKDGYIMDWVQSMDPIEEGERVMSFMQNRSIRVHMIYSPAKASKHDIFKDREDLISKAKEPKVGFNDNFKT